MRLMLPYALSQSSVLCAHAGCEGLLSHFPFPDFSKLILLEKHTS